MREITDQEVSEIAVTAEIGAKEAYEKLAPIVKSDIIRDELIFLTREEDKHHEIISKMAEKTRLILEMLADMERNHYNILRKQYDYITRYPDIYKEEFYDQLMKDINFNF